MDNKTLKATLVKMTGGAVKVRNAASSRGDGIDVFLPKAVRLDAARCAAVMTEVERLTGRRPLLNGTGGYGHLSGEGHRLPNFHIQPLYEAIDG